MSSAALRDDRLVDLLIKQTIEGVTREEQAEIERLFTGYPEADRDEIARTAAALALAGNFADEPLPKELRDRLQADAARWIGARDSKVTDLAGRREGRAAGSATPAGGVRPATAPSRWPWLAAAACLVLAITGWWPRLRDVANPQQANPQQADQQQADAQAQPPAVTPPAPVEPTPAQGRAQLLARGSVVSAPWSNTEDPVSRGVSGDVVWDNATQTGYMRFSGLAPNNPSQSQYQLWIFDARQDDRYPIDGGVFDIPAGATEVVVPIKAKIGVSEPVMFAVTIEKPGGVVVSGREHIVTLAKAAAG